VILINDVNHDLNRLNQSI